MCTINMLNGLANIEANWNPNNQSIREVLDIAICMSQTSMYESEKKT